MENNHTPKYVTYANNWQSNNLVRYSQILNETHGLHAKHCSTFNDISDNESFISLFSLITEV